MTSVRDGMALAAGTLGWTSSEIVRAAVAASAREPVCGSNITPVFSVSIQGTYFPPPFEAILLIAMAVPPAIATVATAVIRIGAKGIVVVAKTNVATVGIETESACRAIVVVIISSNIQKDRNVRNFGKTALFRDTRSTIPISD